jgi:hypothetical protein
VLPTGTVLLQHICIRSSRLRDRIRLQSLDSMLVVLAAKLPGNSSMGRSMPRTNEDNKWISPNTPPGSFRQVVKNHDSEEGRKVSPTTQSIRIASRSVEHNRRRHHFIGVRRRRHVVRRPSTSSSSSFQVTDATIIGVVVRVRQHILTIETHCLMSATEQICRPTDANVTSGTMNTVLSE